MCQLTSYQLLISIIQKKLGKNNNYCVKYKKSWEKLNFSID
nr:MAG TPA: hypothetical protein [Caudoviricetes sp.]